MSNPESQFENDPGYAAAKAFCDALIETRDEINNTGRSLVNAIHLEELWPRRIAELQGLAQVALGYPIKGKAADLRSASDTDNPKIVENIPRRTPGISSPTIVGAVGEVEVRDWRTINQRTHEETVEENLLVFKVNPLLYIHDSSLWDFYIDDQHKKNSNFIGDPFGYYYPEPMPRWLRYQEIEQLIPNDEHLKVVE